MILPTKGIPPRKALLALAGEVLRLLDESKTISRLWDDFRVTSDRNKEITFDWFVLCLDLLFLLGAVELDRGRVRKAKPAIQGIQ